MRAEEFNSSYVMKSKGIDTLKPRCYNSNSDNKRKKEDTRIAHRLCTQRWCKKGCFEHVRNCSVRSQFMGVSDPLLRQ